MVRYIIAIWVLLLGSVASYGEPISVPDELKPWRAWVLHDHPDYPCPFLHNSAQRTCVWPSNLNLTLSQTGGAFDFNLETFAEAWVTLPGEAGLWPEQVMSFAEALVVVEKDGRPQVQLPAGLHSIVGSFQWQQLPRTLKVPADAGLLNLKLNGAAVPRLTFTEAGELWLANQTVEKTEQERDSLEIKVFRHLTDSNPAVIETLVQLTVSGSEREVESGPLLLPGFTPRAFSSDLPARIEGKGQLRVQLKPGRWEIRLLAQQAQAFANLTFEPMDSRWPKQEIWVFEAVPNLRTVQLQGLPSVDPSQTQLPDNWRQWPAYLAEAGQTLTLTPLHRGEPQAPANRLTLTKTLWLDFTGSAYTVKDRIDGTYFQSGRLEAVKAYELGRAEQAGQPQLITQLSEGAAAGIEIRDPNLNLTAVSRIPKQAELPISGWQVEFDRVDSQLQLPPGWSLLHASGADSVSGSWLSGWSLWDIFLVLIIAVSLGRTVSPLVGGLALCTLLVTYQRSGAPLFIWLELVALLALTPYVSGRFGAGLKVVAGLSFLVLVLILLPFAVDQARLALYPQLEHRAMGPNDGGRYQAPTVYSESDAFEDKMTSLPVEYEVSSLQRLSGVSEAKKMRAKEKSQLNQAYEPGQKIQVGPGLPGWSWNSVSMHWSGPVTLQESTTLYLISPLWNRLGYILALLLPVALALLVLLKFTQSPLPQLLGRLRGLSFSAMLIGLMMFQASPSSFAASTPAEGLLKTLEQRLMAPPTCLPNCTAISAVNVNVDGEAQLKVQIRAHISADMAFPLPARVGGWMPTQVLVNGQRAAWLKQQDGQLWVRLKPGRHSVNVSGPLGSREQVDLNFRQNLHNVTVTSPGWRISGLPDVKQTSQSLQLQREQKATTEQQANLLLPDPIAPFVIVTRRIELGLEWLVTTEVTRVAPTSGAIHLSVPLLPGEAPNSGQLDAEGNMLVSFDDHQQHFEWQSSLRVFDDLTLTAAEQGSWSEVWVLATSPIWHSTTEGIPPLAGTGNGSSPIWQPWPGEQVHIHVLRPQAVAGRQLSIDGVNLTQAVGKRADELTLNLVMRASQGDQYSLQLPDGAQFKGVKIDDVETPISHSQNTLQIPVRPGEHRVQINWLSEEGAQFKVITPALDLQLPSSNIRIDLQLPRDRWLLFVGGPAVGPAILFWGILIIVLMLAVALGRSGMTPLKPYAWVLLSLGVVTFNLYVLVTIAAWFIALYVRGKKPLEANTQAFNFVQLMLFGFSLVTLALMLSSVPASLLSRPDMMVVGNHSMASSLHWYQDMAAGPVPQAYAISLPILVYRIAMLAWSLWLAFALMRWIPWAWRQLGVNGYWYTPESRLKPSSGKVKQAEAKDQSEAKDKSEE